MLFELEVWVGTKLVAMSHQPVHGMTMIEFQALPEVQTCRFLFGRLVSHKAEVLLSKPILARPLQLKWHTRKLLFLYAVMQELMHASCLAILCVLKRLYRRVHVDGSQVYISRHSIAFFAMDMRLFGEIAYRSQRL